MRTRKPTLSENINTLKDEIRRREYTLSFIRDESTRAKEEKWISNAKKQVSGFYAPAIR